MIRIDEIYYNVFVKALQHQKTTALHWFDPFGSVDIKDLCNVPALTAPDRRLIFWDQEPVYRHTAEIFFDQFCHIYHGAKIIVTSEQHSDDLDWLCHTYGLQAAHYFFHGWAALDWYRGHNHSFVSTPLSQRDIKYPLFVPNNIVGGHRQHRINFLANLMIRHAVTMNRISFPAVCPYEKVCTYELAQRCGVDLHGVDLPLIIDSDRNHADRSHNIDFWQQGQECMCHVVTETAWSGRLHLTEKTFKPIVMQQPFVLVGPRHSLRYLRQYGFRTFNHIWDETYDTLPDASRMQAVADLCAEISHWDHGRLRLVMTEAHDVIQHNFDWFYGGFQDVLWQELTTMIGAWQ